VAVWGKMLEERDLVAVVSLGTRWLAIRATKAGNLVAAKIGAKTAVGTITMQAAVAASRAAAKT